MIDNIMKQITFLSWKTPDEWTPLLEPEGVVCSSCYKCASSFIVASIRTLWYKMKLPMAQIWFSSIVKNHKGIIVLHDVMINVKIFEYLRKNNPDAKLILYYINNISGKNNYIDQARNCNWDVWTFNPADAEKYRLKINHLFYSNVFFEKFKTDLPDIYDIVFIGRDKGRMGYVQSLASHPALKDLKWYLYFVAHPFYKRYNKKAYKKYMPYERLLEIQNRSTAILEIQHEDGKGATQRTIEALYFKKKLITTNKYLQHMDYYHPNNIFILDVDDINTLPDFLDVPYHPINPDIVSQYSLESWRNKFIQDVSQESDIIKT